MVKIKAFVTLWKRPEVTRICFEGLKRMQGYKPDEYNMSVQCVGSEPGVFAPMCKEYGFDYYNYPNRPLGAKCNAGLREALKDDWDFLMIVNSDDIIGNALLDSYKDYYKTRYVVGVKGCYFYDVRQKEMVRFEGYDNRVMSMGPGRIIHRDVVEACKGKLWKDRLNRGLNGSCLKRINRYGFDETIIAPDAVIVDIKSGINLHDFDKFPGERVDASTILNSFSNKEQSMIKGLCK